MEYLKVWTELGGGNKECRRPTSLTGSLAGSAISSPRPLCPTVRGHLLGDGQWVSSLVNYKSYDIHIFKVTEYRENRNIHLERFLSDW